MIKVLLVLAAAGGFAAAARKRASGQATATLWREATKNGTGNPSHS